MWPAENYESPLRGYDSTFFNLTLKETHFLKWFNTYCAGVRYVFKGDDDVFVSVDNILEYLEGIGPTKNLLVGDVLFKAKPIRKKENKAVRGVWLYPAHLGSSAFL
ncbi:hypothetical protein CRUP_030222 [Coryphaenoides rupestris]|nr:hypothetical protein CRUP_030222 [Coryphaenoides rupestris]